MASVWGALHIMGFVIIHMLLKVSMVLAAPPVTCLSSSSVRMYAPVGCGGRLANSSGVKLWRYSTSFHARTISTVIFPSSHFQMGGGVAFHPPLDGRTYTGIAIRCQRLYCWSS